MLFRSSVVTATTLVTEDGVPIEAIHLPGPKDLAIVVAHGFTLSWQRPNVWRIANRFNRSFGVLTFDFRGHGRSGGLSTLGDREINDLDVVVRWARELGYQRVAAVGFSMGASIVLRYAGLVGGLDAVVSVSPKRAVLPNGSGRAMIGVSALSGAVRSITSTELSRMASVRACSTDMGAPSLKRS